MQQEKKLHDERIGNGFMMNDGLQRSNQKKNKDLHNRLRGTNLALINPFGQLDIVVGAPKFKVKQEMEDPCYRSSIRWNLQTSGKEESDDENYYTCLSDPEDMKEEVKPWIDWVRNPTKNKSFKKKKPKSCMKKKKQYKKKQDVKGWKILDELEYATSKEELRPFKATGKRPNKKRYRNKPGRQNEFLQRKQPKAYERKPKKSGIHRRLEKKELKEEIKQTVKEVISNCFPQTTSGYVTEGMIRSWRLERKKTKDLQDIKAMLQALLEKQEQDISSDIQKKIDDVLGKTMSILTEVERHQREKDVNEQHEEYSLLNNFNGLKLGFTEDTVVLDSGSTVHMMKTDVGMTKWEPSASQVKLGDGKLLKATKKGDYAVTFRQTNGSTLDTVLKDCKCIPAMKMNLFSLPQAMKRGWNVRSEGCVVILFKDGNEIRFDRMLKTEDGFLLGVEMLPRQVENDTAMPATGGSTVWNINRMHQVFNHASEEVLRATAKEYNWTLTGKYRPCLSCQVANAKQKNVPKETTNISTIPGERLCLDLTTMRDKSFGGNKHWLVMVDDCTGKAWSRFLKQKSELGREVLIFLSDMKNNKTPVKIIRMDNAGENLALMKMCHEHTDPTISMIKFELTPRDSP